MRTHALAAALGLVLVLVLGWCSLATDLPEVQPEESARPCENGIDDDLDGDVDCADDSCRAFCWDGSRLIPPGVSDCFADDARGLAFRVVDVDGRHERCEPAPDPVPLCGEGVRLLPGASGCRAPGSACDEVEWPAVPDDGRPTLHVRAGATGGDGTAGSPLGSIDEALARASGGARILLARGEHVAPASIERAVELHGVCAADTLVRGSVRLDAAGASLVDLALDGSLDVRAAAQVIGASIGGAVTVDAADLTIDDAAIVAPAGWAISAVNGASVALVASTIDAAESGVVVEGSVLAIHAVAIRGTSTTGVEVGAGARAADVAGLVVEPVAGTGVHLACDALEERCADLHDVQVRFPSGVLPEGGRGIVVRDGRVRLRRAYVGRSREDALDLEHATVELEDSTLEATEAAAGVRVGLGGELRALRVFLRNDRPRGLLVEAGGKLIASDLDVFGSERTATSDMCVEALAGSSLSMTRFVLESCGVCGLRLEADVELLLGDGLVAASSRGTCLARDATYAVGALTSGVSYRDNRASDLYRE